MNGSVRKSKLTGLAENGKGKRGEEGRGGGRGEKGPHRDGRHTKVTRETHGGTRFIVSATRALIGYSEP
jgi:hypothetical protein